MLNLIPYSEYHTYQFLEELSPCGSCGKMTLRRYERGGDAFLFEGSFFCPSCRSSFCLQCCVNGKKGDKIDPHFSRSGGVTFDDYCPLCKRVYKIGALNFNGSRAVVENARGLGAQDFLYIQDELRKAGFRGD